MQRDKTNSLHVKNNFFQTSKIDPKSTRAAEQTGNDFFLKSNVINRKENDKKPFDKKSWRLQKYSKKYKLDQWENRRKKTVLREYYKQIDPNERKIDVQKIYEDLTTEDTHKNQLLDDDNVSNANNYKNKEIVASGKRASAFIKARDRLARLKEEKRLKKEDFLTKKLEKEEKLKLYKQKKAEKFKKLNKKTKRGQPVMKDRLEMLLEQIQKNM